MIEVERLQALRNYPNREYDHLRQRLVTTQSSDFKYRWSSRWTRVRSTMMTGFCIAAVLSSFVFGLSLGPIFAAVFSLGLVYYIWVEFPRDRESRRRAGMYAEFPIFLRAFGVALRQGYPPDASFSRAVSAVPTGELHRELRKAVRAIESGDSPAMAMSNFVSRTGTPEVRAMVAAFYLFADENTRWSEPFTELAEVYERESNYVDQVVKRLQLIRKLFAVTVTYIALGAVGFLATRPVINISDHDLLYVELGGCMLVAAFLTMLKLTSFRSDSEGFL